MEPQDIAPGAAVERVKSAVLKLAGRHNVSGSDLQGVTGALDLLAEALDTQLSQLREEISALKARSS